MKTHAHQIAANCCRMALANEPWQDLGFKGRPRYGAMFRSLRPAWKVALEDKVLQEIIAIFSAAYVIAEADGGDLVEQLVRWYMEKPELSVAFGFHSQVEGAEHLRRAINAYVAASPRDWPNILSHHLPTLAVPDKKLRARLLIGGIQFCRTAEYILSDLRKQRL